MYDFPNSPVIGQVVTMPDGTERVWDGTKWVAASIGGGGGFLPLSGGILTGPLTLAADPAAPLQAATKQYVDAHAGTVIVSDTPPTSPACGGLWWDSLGTQLYLYYQDPTSDQWVNVTNLGGGSGGIPDAPYDDTVYGRSDGTWTAVLPITGGTLTGPLTLAGDPTGNLNAVTLQYFQANAASSNSPALTGIPTAPTAPQNTDTTQIATTQFVLNQAATTLPLMDGIAAVGQLFTYARADHVHPTDTSLLPLSGGTMTGTLTLAGSPIDYLDAATKQYVDAAVAAEGVYVDAPSDGRTYGRMDGTWVTVLPISGGTLAGPLTLASDPSGNLDPVTLQYFTANAAPMDSPAFTGVPTAPTAPLNSDTTEIATTQFVLNQAATTLPLMDGMAAVGQLFTYARADHVHPTDTSLLPLSGGTMTGPLTLAAASPGASDAVSKQYVDTVIANGPSVTVGDTPPANPPSGALWWDSTGTQLYLWYVDPDGGQWVNVSGTGSSSTDSSGGTTVTVGDTPPSDPASGDLWWDSAGTQLYLWYVDPNGSQWVNVTNAGSDGGSGSGYVDAPFDGNTYGRMDADWNPVLPIAGGTLTGTLTLAADPTGNLDATTKQYVDGKFLPMSGGTLTGSLILAADPTANLGAATKQYIDSKVPPPSVTTPIMDGVATVGSVMTWARADHVHPTDVSRAPINSPVFTGNPQAPTRSANDNSTNLATTAYVDSHTWPYAALPPEVQQVPLAFTLIGKPAANARANIAMPLALNVPGNLTGTVFFATTLASADTVFTLNKISSGVTTTIGTIVVTAGSSTGCTLSGTGGLLGPGDALQLVGPASPDLTLSDLCITILATRL